MIRIFFPACFQCGYQSLYDILYGKRILLRLFLNIDQKPSTKKISVFDSLFCQLMRHQKLLLCPCPASHTD